MAPLLQLMRLNIVLWDQTKQIVKERVTTVAVTAAADCREKRACSWGGGCSMMTLAPVIVRETDRKQHTATIFAVLS